ncbi:hypothetical protein [Methylobacterium sp. J-070]|uniref:hypothetical protein n=1 Tax=Methylobacterium sp. J-070 TaxID=2836650 RepID=UPI001FBAAB38|nr:hypothetical protein [Methylobacterium sp. J-070]MCJ2053701.1 hypothetical protein [Methylobacterium sp. J-070]
METELAPDQTKEKRLFVDFDGRTKFARKLRETRERLIAERGGLNTLDAVRLDAIHAFALLSLERERMTAARSAGEAIDLDQFGMLCDRCDRLSRRMGPPVSKAARPLDLASHLAGRRP